MATPLVVALQNAADAATATQPLPTDMVVVRPGTGEILAVSSNAAADPSHALSGRFPPGSTMKTMTATALLSAGKVTPDTPVPCPGTTVVDGRSFQNENQFDLGTVPLTTAFDQSCNTTFIQQGMTLPDAALSQAAASYGVGTAWKLPVPLFGGTVPADATGTAKAADQIGQGQVLMSPAALALVAAGIGSGKPAAPVEVTGAPAAGTAPTGPSPAGARPAPPDDAAGRPRRDGEAAGRPAERVRQDRHRGVRHGHPAAGARLVHGLPARRPPGRHRLRRPRRGRRNEHRSPSRSPTPSSAPSITAGTAPLQGPAASL